MESVIKIILFTQDLSEESHLSSRCLKKPENNKNLPLFSVFGVVNKNKRILNIWGLFSDVITIVTSLLEVKWFCGNGGIKFSAQNWNIQNLISCFITNHANDHKESTRQKRFYALKLFWKKYSSLTITLC